MESLIWILLGAILVTYGWYWGGVTEARTTAAATGLAALILAGAAVFNPEGADPVVWAFAGLAAVFGTLVALSAYWEVEADRTLGLYSLFLALASALLLSVVLTGGGVLTLTGLAALILVVIFALVFISAALAPQVRGLRAFVGWTTLVGGAVVAFIGFAPALGIGLV